MSVIDEGYRANQEYAKAFQLGHLPMPPARKLAILACMVLASEINGGVGLQ